MALKLKNKNVHYIAIAVAIVLHLAAFAVFYCIKVKAETVAVTPEAETAIGFETIEKFVQAEPFVPKPKVSNSIVEKMSQPKTKAQTNGLLKMGQKQSIDSDSADVTMLVQEMLLLDEGLSLKTEQKTGQTWNSFASDRKICYLVDCSGSMKPVANAVKSQLTEVIANMEQDEFFSIIMFSGNEFLQWPTGRKLARASTPNKKKAKGFIAKIQMQGKTDVIAAFKQAIKVTSYDGEKVDLICFLTDGFELSGKKRAKVAQQIINLMNNFATGIKINTIGFWSAEKDSEMLENIAGETGGKFVLVNGS